MRRSSGRDPSKPTGLTSSSTRLAIGFVLLIGLSGGMIAIQGGGSLAVVAAAVLGSLVVGSALTWYLYWILS
ncbi:hypothetical protein ACFO5R_15715 [Halosolutus amylolyticus]|uniref:Uncharacterized protein n=1 Tax=Halosolutus amylolyticus TaxID=2932267 RepID=A0ABD5PS07_9EURY|nr:hypothetical protein [Halosolutus amylolyticus]